MNRRDIAQLFKRFFITFMCSVPLFLALGFLLENKISNIVMIIVLVILGGAIFAIEEWIAFKQIQKRKKLKEQIKDPKLYFEQLEQEIQEKLNKKNKSKTIKKEEQKTQAKNDNKH